MAVVFTPDPSGAGANPIAIAGGVWMLFGTLTFSGSYATGGDSLDLLKRLAMLSTIRQVIAIGQPRGFTVEYDKTAKKLLVHVATAATPAGAEHAAAAYLALLTATPVPIAFLCK